MKPDAAALKDISPEDRALLEQRLLKKAVKRKAPQFVQRDASKPCPLSPAQERVWIHDQIHPGTAVYNEAEAIKLEGALNEVFLEQALNQVVQRHEILRMRVGTENGKPFSEFPPRNLELRKQDLTGEPDRAAESKPSAESSHSAEPNRSAEPKGAAESKLSAEQNRLAEPNRFAELLLTEANVPFDLSNDLLIRASLFKVGPQQHILLLVLHHIICDRVSIGILMREVSEIYSASESGCAPVLQSLSIQYGDYAACVRQKLASGDLTSQRQFWHSKAEALSTALELPYDRTKPLAPTFPGRRQAYPLDSVLCERISECAKQNDVSLFEFLCAGLGALFFKYTGQPKFAIAVPVNKRSSQELQPMIGFFADTHFVSFDFEHCPTAAELLQQVRQELLNVYKNGVVPLEEIRRELQRTTNAQSFLPVLLNHRYEQDLLTALNLPGIKTEQLSVYNDCSKFELLFTITTDGSRITINTEFNTDLFNDVTVEL